MSFADLDKVAQEVAAEFEVKTYAELEALARRQKSDPDALVRRKSLPNGEVFVDVTLVKFGRLRRRVSVEVTVSQSEAARRDRVACVYFERFENGRLSKPWVRWDIIGIAVILGGAIIAVVRFLATVF